MRLKVVNEKNCTFETENLNIEMTRSETGFLIDLLQKYKPKKILEVGVAAGGTTSLILKNITGDQRLISVDICDRYYRDNTYITGYIAQQTCTEEELGRHTVYLGKDIISCIGDIGGDIDFCIIDTMHVMPGELMHFIAVYPFLSKNCCVVLHDLTLNKELEKGKIRYGSEAFCSKVLFSSIVSQQKLLLSHPLSNIGAFFVDDSTKTHIENIFLALSISWHYYPSEYMIEYANFIKKHYSPFCLAYFLACARFQADLVRIKQQTLKEEI